MTTSAELRSTCLEAVSAGAREILSWYGHVQPRAKSPRDFVTEADLASQAAIGEVISRHYPDHEFVGEESERNASISLKGWQWFVDPLDGTTNFLHGLPYFAVSVAVALDGRVLAGAVLDPVRDECFSAARGEGARLGEDTIEASAVQTLDDALLAFSLPSRVTADDPELRDFTRIAYQCQALRRLGAAALNLCYVAAGRLDGYWARKLHAWDLAAGSLIVAEAGGSIASLGKDTVELTNRGLVAAASQSLHEQLLRELL